MINWSNTHTDKERYEKVGILDDMIKYFTYEKIVSPTIIDACCSDGMAIQYSVNKLKNELGITPFVIGIDISKDVKKYAEKNVDEFINSDILNVDNKKSSADIVICHKAAIYIHGDQRSKIIQKCSTFLKKDGLLITDADAFPNLTFWNKIKRFMSYCNNNTFKKYVKTYRKNDANDHAHKIQTNWNKKSQIWKYLWNLEINIMKHIGKISTTSIGFIILVMVQQHGMR